MLGARCALMLNLSLCCRATAADSEWEPSTGAVGAVAHRGVQNECDSPHCTPACMAGWQVGRALHHVRCEC